MLSELVKGFFVDPEAVKVVKATGKNECALFIEGQSAVDGGFKLDYSAKRVTQAVNDTLDGIEREDGEDEDEED